MSLAAACGWTFARTVVLCLLAAPLIVLIERWLRRRSDARRPFVLAILLAPFLFPELLVGYTFREFALASPARAEWLCAGLLFIRIVPVGVVALLASPASLISASAIHCRWMLLRANVGSRHEWWQLLKCYWHGPVRRMLPALSLIGLVSFQEFELAALLQTASWTDWFISAQRFGLSRAEMLQQAAWPVVMQLPLLVGAVSCWSGQQATRPLEDDVISTAAADRRSGLVIIYLGLALTCGCLIPLAIMAGNLPAGLKLLIRQPTQWTGLGREMVIASAVSVCAGLTTWFVGGAWTAVPRANRLSKNLRQGLLWPGLAGSLLLSLSAVVLLQQPWLRPIYDTPLPWVLALLVWLLPRAVLLRLWLAAVTRTEGVHLAELLESPVSSSGESTKSIAVDRTSSPTITEPPRSRIHSADLLFRLRDQPQLLGMGLLCYWAYLDLPTAYLLAPSGMPSGLVRLYNFMHFGRSAALSAESLLFFGLPLLATYLTILLFRWRRRHSGGVR